MKRVYTALGITFAALLVLGTLFVQFSQTSNAGSALRLLGRGEPDFQEARRRILYSLGDPAPSLFKFLQKKSVSRRAREQALQIMRELARHQDVPGGACVAPLLSDTSYAMRMSALGTMEAMHGLAGTDSVIHLYRQTRDTGLFQQCYRTLWACATPLRTALDSAMSARDSAALAAIAGRIEQYPVRKGEFYTLLARHYAKQGDLSTAGEYYRRLGIVGRWWITGGFLGRDRFEGGLEDSYAPEKQPFNPGDRFELGGDLGVAAWTPLQRVEDWGTINFRNLFARQDNTCAYTFTYVVSPDERPAVLYYHGDDNVRMWLNDSLLRTPEIAAQNETTIPVTLKRGPNKLFVKTTQLTWGWYLFLRIADMNGEAMPGLVSSLTPIPRETATDALIDAAQKRTGGWERAVDSMDVQDGAAAQAVLNVVVDRAAPLARRLAALDVLAAMNAHRQVPAGQRELIDLAAECERNAAANPILRAAVRMLIDMRTTRALDVGLALRARPDAELAWLGNGLVSTYCRARLMDLGDVGRADQPAAMQRAMHEVESMSPVDPWVLERTATWREALGEKERGATVRARIAMPGRWVVKPIAARLADRAAVAAALVETPLDTALFDPTTPFEPKAPWLSQVSEPEGSGRGAFSHFTHPTVWSKGTNRFALTTVVTADRACSLMVHVTLPATYTLWVNGSYVGEGSVRLPSTYHLGESYAWQRVNFDVDHFPVVLHPGRNTVALAFVNDWVMDSKYRLFRVGFSRPDGTPVGCARNALELR